MASCAWVTPDVVSKLKLNGQLEAEHDALQHIQQDCSLACAEVQYPIDFIRTSQRGVILRRAEPARGGSAGGGVSVRGLSSRKVTKGTKATKSALQDVCVPCLRDSGLMKLGLIAATAAFRFLWRGLGHDVTVIAIKEATRWCLLAADFHWISLGQLGKCISTLTGAWPVMAGQVKHTKLFADIVRRSASSCAEGEEHRRAQSRASPTCCAATGSSS